MVSRHLGHNRFMKMKRLARAACRRERDRIERRALRNNMRSPEHGDRRARSQGVDFALTIDRRRVGPHPGVLELATRVISSRICEPERGRHVAPDVKIFVRVERVGVGEQTKENRAT